MKKKSRHSSQTSKVKLNPLCNDISYLLIILIIAIVITMIVTTKLPESAATEAEKITAMILDDHKVSFATNGIVDERKLKEFQTIGYEDFKRSLNIKRDFCIYIEDEKKNIILAKGSGKLSSNGLICAE